MLDLCSKSMAVCGLCVCLLALFCLTIYIQLAVASFRFDKEFDISMEREQET
jgi:hypothetical protein